MQWAIGMQLMHRIKMCHNPKYHTFLTNKIASGKYKIVDLIDAWKRLWPRSLAVTLPQNQDAILSLFHWGLKLQNNWVDMLSFVLSDFRFYFCLPFLEVSEALSVRPRSSWYMVLSHAGLGAPIGGQAAWPAFCWVSRCPSRPSPHTCVSSLE